MALCFVEGFGARGSIKTGLGLSTAWLSKRTRQCEREWEFQPCALSCQRLTLALHGLKSPGAPGMY